MKITRNHFRLRLAIGAALLGTLMLVAADWSHVVSTFHAQFGSLDSLLHSRYRASRDPKDTPFIIGGMMLVLAGMLALEFESDPPPRKDPWEE